MTENIFYQRDRGPATPSVRCLFCATIGTWWDCSCVWAKRIRGEVKPHLPRPRTRMVDGMPIIECCEELREAAKKASVIMVADVATDQLSESLANPAEVSESEDKTILCAYCHKPFVPKRTTARFCSDGCRALAQKDKRP